MYKGAIAVIILIFSVSISLAQSKVLNIAPFEGLWKVKGSKNDDGSIYTQKQLINLSKENISFNKDSVKIFGEVVRKPVYNICKVNTKKYLWDTYQLTAQYFKINADSLIDISITGSIYSKKYHKILSVDYDFFFDGKTLFFLQNGATFLLYKPVKSVNRNSGH